MNLFRTLVVGAALAVAALPGWAQDVVVYHIDDTAAQAVKGLRNVRNHLDVDPTARIGVATQALGVDFLMQAAMDVNGGEFAAPCRPWSRVASGSRSARSR